MTLCYPGDRTLKAIIRRHDRDVLLGEVLRLGPTAVYRGLLGHARDLGFNDGWAAHAFKEIFGAWPRPQDRAEPTLPPVEVEEWIASRARRRRRNAA
jgi:hypothetical protein